MTIEKSQLYKHLNGFTYEVEGLAEDDSGVPYVVHRGLHDSRLWVRTVENFSGLKDGKPRFTLIC